MPSRSLKTTPLHQRRETSLQTCYTNESVTIILLSSREVNSLAEIEESCKMSSFLC